MINSVSDLQEAIRSMIQADNHKDSGKQLKEDFFSAVRQNEEQISEWLKVIKEEFLCYVCLEVVLQACVTPCKHVFCRFCLELCLLQRDHCPICRTKMPGSSHRKVLNDLDEIVEYAMAYTKARSRSQERKVIESRKARYDGMLENSPSESLDDSFEAENSGSYETDEDYWTSAPSSPSPSSPPSPSSSSVQS